MTDEGSEEKEIIQGPGQPEQKPEAPEWLIENIAEASKNARKIYFLHMGFLTYCVLTVLGTSDRAIILDETAHLPIVGVDVSLNGFFIMAPIIAIMVFGYFQLYLQRLKGLIDDLRTNYAEIEKRRLYPWMINISEDPEPGMIGKLQEITVSFSLWTSLPIVLTLLGFWYIRKHEPFWSYVVASLSIAGTLIVVWFWWKYESGRIRKKLTKVTIIGFIGICILLTFQISILTFLIPLAKTGLVPEFLRPHLCVNLSYENLVTKPEVDHKRIPWQQLGSIHLEGADLRFSVLKKAYLRRAHLKDARLNGAVLDEANLQAANLSGANLVESSLREAILIGTDLTEVYLSRADLFNADLRGANLTKANLEATDLTEANLIGANLTRVLKLTTEQLKKVKSLYGATLDPGLMEQIKKAHPDLLEMPKE